MSGHLVTYIGGPSNLSQHVSRDPPQRVLLVVDQVTFDSLPTARTEGGAKEATIRLRYGRYRLGEIPYEDDAGRQHWVGLWEGWERD